MTKPKLSYYNYFLFLSLMLIAGYMLASLLFLNRTTDSGKRAAEFSKTIERTNAIINQTYHLEGLGFGYLLNRCDDTYDEYEIHRGVLLNDYDTLKKHLNRLDIANENVQELSSLVDRRISIMDDLIHKDSLHSMSHESRIAHMNIGEEVTDSIIIELKEIREINDVKRLTSINLASNYTSNAMFVLTVFGVVMLIIVFISFNRMKNAINQNLRNVQEIKQINLELKSMNENLENFAYVASHDLNEPLRKIRTFGDLVRSELKSDVIDKENVVSHIERMQNASARMQQLINDLLSYSRVSRDFQADTKVDLKSVIQTVMNDLEIRIRESSADIRLNIDTEPLYVDEIQMRQLFQNLISNAIKFRKPGESPEILIESSIIKRENIPFEEAKELSVEKYCRVDVSDNGIGFDQQYANKIFAVFQRLHGRSAYEGTGIGLSICKKICENHKGFILADSTEGQGAKFSIYLPINSGV